MSSAKQAPSAAFEGPQKDGKPLKPCCACPETKRPRDVCIVEQGEDKCGELIEAHKQCMRALGFKV